MSSTVNPIELAGVNRTDRAAVAAYLRSAEGRQDWLAGAPSAAEHSAFLLSCLPTLAPPAEPGRSPFDASDALDRMSVRRDHAVRAREADLFRATDEAGRHLAGLVALAEFVRTCGSTAVRNVPGPSTSTADLARAVAGDIAREALLVGGVPLNELGLAGPSEIACVRDVVERLAAGEPVPSTAPSRSTITAIAPAKAEMRRVAGPRGASRWLACHLSRAFIVAADAAQAVRDWSAVEMYATRALLATLSAANEIGPGLPIDTGMALTDALNRIGLAHRARADPDGVWRTRDAALHHWAAVHVLAWCTGPTESLEPRRLLRWFTTLLNLASAWTDEVEAEVRIASDPSDFGYRRAVFLLRGLLQPDLAMTQTSLDASGSCGVDIPEGVFIEFKSKRFAWLRAVLLNDYAEIQWRAGRHEMLGRRLSRWQTEPHKKAEAVKDLLHRGLLAHVRALTDLAKDPRRHRHGPVSEFWYWRHQKNFQAKVDELRKPGHIYAYILDTKDLCKEISTYVVDVPNEFRGHQMGTLDTYAEQNSQLTYFGSSPSSPPTVAP